MRSRRVAARPEVKYAPKAAVQQWIAQRKNIQEDGPSAKSIAKQMEVRNQIVRELQKAEAEILLGSDSRQIFQIPGFSLHTELADMVEAGLTPGQALGAGTRAPGAFFGKLDKFGTVSEGSRADLILAEGNRLENTGNLAKRTGVMAAGRWHPDAELQKQLEGIAAEYAAAPAPQQ